MRSSLRFVQTTYSLSPPLQFGRACLQRVPVAALISTLVMASTSLSASHKLPSGPTTMWRTPPPPDGRIGHVWNFSVAGSNRTSMFGLALADFHGHGPPIMIVESPN